MNTELCIWQDRVIVGFKATYATSGCHLDIHVDKEIYDLFDLEIKIFAWI